MVEVLANKKRLSPNVSLLRKRREESLSAALLKLEDIYDSTKMYCMHENKDVMRFVLQDLKSKIKTLGTAEDSTTKYRYIETDENPKEFTKNIIDLCSSVYENVVQKEVSNFEKDMSEYLKHAEKHQINRCQRSVSDMVGLFEVSKTKDMESDLFKIYTDLFACVNYNAKILKEVELG